MKKILTLLGTITLIATSTTSLVACNTSKYTEEKLAELKEENKISINGNTLEGIAPQERPFNKIDSKGYFVIGRGDKNNDGRIAKFKNNEGRDIYKGIIDSSIDKYELRRVYFGNSDYFSLTVNKKGSALFSDIARGHQDTSGSYFKPVYRGEGKDKPETPNIDPKTGKIIDGK